MKGIYGYICGKFSIQRMLGSGGMPSAHSAVVISLTTWIGLHAGIDSDIFAVCIVMAMIIIYDALNVRYQVGLHARVLNTLTPNDGQTLGEHVGHTPIEALCGGIVGYIVAIVCMYV
jgi:acid phosphatase family membrane protein YuiD